MNSKIFLLILAGYSGLLQGQSETLKSSPLGPMKVSSTPSTVHVSLDISGGYASYPVLGMPRAPGTNIRADRTTGGQDLMENRGVSLGAEVTRRDRSVRFPYNLGLGGFRVSTPPAAGVPIASSYARVFSYAVVSLPSGISGLNVEPKVEARRSMYKNVESGHYLDSLLLGGGVKLKTVEHLFFDAGYMRSVMARFGVSQPSSIGTSGALADTSSSVQEFSVGALWEADPWTSFKLGFVQESGFVAMNDVNSYSAFGLLVTSPVGYEYQQNRSRQMALTVNQFLFTTTKHF